MIKTPNHFIKNVRCYQKQTNEYETVDLVISNGMITDITKQPLPENGCDVIDGQGLFVFSSLSDIHTHGALLCEFATDPSDKIANCMKFYTSQGVTSLFPTTLTAKPQDILHAVKEITLAAKQVDKVSIDGIHIEGPFLSAKRKGAHIESLLLSPDIDFVDQIIQISDGLKIRLTVAPEYENGISFIKQCVERGVEVSLGHTDAGYDIIMRALEAGADCFTHLYNAMSPLHHREPGAVGTALAEDVYTELICDGIHVHPEVVKLTSKMKSKEKLILITDSMKAAGLQENSDVALSIGGLQVKIQNGVATTSDGTLAGSVIGLFDSVMNYRKFSGASLYDAFCAANINPRKLTGFADKAGSVEIGKRADLILCSEQTLFYTILNGKIVYSATSQNE